MNRPLLSPGTKTCGTSETCQAMLPSPPPLHPDHTNWIDHVNNSLKGMPSNEQRDWKNPSIYRVPAFITNLNCKAYQPQVVSFGPYHHGDHHLWQMEDHKHRVVLHFLKRCGKTLEPFLDSLRKVARDLKERYDTLDTTGKEGGGDRFLELMITDGCFMLEVMRSSISEKNDYALNDPIFSIQRLRYIKSFIMRDMLMLENQLPILVLYKLVAVESDNEKGDEFIHGLILKFFSLDTCVTGMGKCLHVVDVFRNGLLMETKKVQHELENGGLEATEETQQRIRSANVNGEIIWSAIPGTEETEQKTRSAPKETEQIIRSATELHDTGIQFKKSQTRSLKDISFAGGVLRLPIINVDDTTESVFLNLMTFERLHIGAGNEITAYVTFMDNIINNEGDVALLHAQGIIQNAIGCDKAVAKLFNSLCKEVPIASNESLIAVQEKISKYCEKPWNKWRANLNHAYFRSPWSILSLIGAIFLFVLTIIQTIYTVLSYI